MNLALVWFAPSATQRTPFLIDGKIWSGTESNHENIHVKFSSQKKSFHQKHGRNRKPKKGVAMKIEKHGNQYARQVYNTDAYTHEFCNSLHLRRGGTAGQFDCHRAGKQKKRNIF